MLAHDLKWLQENYPQAYAGLLECYQNDSCLEFFLNELGHLMARGIPGDHLENYQWAWLPGKPGDLFPDGTWLDA